MLSDAAVRALVLAGLRRLAKLTPNKYDDEILDFLVTTFEDERDYYPPHQGE
jgi:hypothetical protein